MHWSFQLTPSRRPYEVTPNDSTILPDPAPIYVGVGGDVRLKAVGSSSPVTYRNVPSGGKIDVRVSRVYADGTTASGLIAEA